MLVMETNLTHLEKAVKHATLARITTDEDIVVKADIFPQLVDKAWLERLDITIMESFGDLIQGYIRTGRITVYYIY